MKRFFPLAILFFTTSCYGYCTVSYLTQERAQTMYETVGTVLSDISQEEAAQRFGQCYRKTSDYVYSYKTLWDEKLILVRYEKAVTYVEVEKLKTPKPQISTPALQYQEPEPQIQIPQYQIPSYRLPVFQEQDPRF